MYNRLDPKPKGGCQQHLHSRRLARRPQAAPTVWSCLKLDGLSDFISALMLGSMQVQYTQQKR